MRSVCDTAANGSRLITERQLQSSFAAVLQMFPLSLIFCGLLAFSQLVFCHLEMAQSVYSSGQVSFLHDSATDSLLACHKTFNLFISKVPSVQRGQ